MYYSNDNLMRFTINVLLHYGNERKMCLKKKSILIVLKQVQFSYIFSDFLMSYVFHEVHSLGFSDKMLTQF